MNSPSSEESASEERGLPLLYRLVPHLMDFQGASNKLLATRLLIVGTAVSFFSWGPEILSVYLCVLGIGRGTLSHGGLYPRPQLDRWHLEHAARVEQGASTEKLVGEWGTNPSATKPTESYPHRESHCLAFVLEIHLVGVACSFSMSLREHKA
jgi:hypothetical protein